ncbi:MAG: DUF479 domain-containing protein [Bacteroidetes bacterium]|nr:DUF479 domain-containing protein [Bacteroidota bacterium]
MNYLAHAFLSNNNKGLLVGNFIADHIRGNNFENFSPEIIEGIRLHRKIDAFTDTHPEFKNAKRIFYKDFEKYSGVLIDIYFDHLLAKNFEQHSKVVLPDFSQQVYSVYKENETILPVGSSRFLGYVLKNNIYTAYADVNGIEKVLFHLSHRINHNVRLDFSVETFEEHETQLQAAFDNFFADIRKELSL